jgi:hypothetical protein
MRKFLALILILCTLISYSQRVRGFGGISIYRHTSFDKSGFVNLSAGAECKLNQTIRPEIEMSVFLGLLQTRENSNDEGILTDELELSFIATNISFCPKICLADGNDETNIFYFQILPIYSITKVMAKGSLLRINPNDVSKYIVEVDRYSEIRHSLGIGIGVYFNFSEKYNNSLALNLYFNGIDFGNSFSNLKFGKSSEINTYSVLGLGLKCYFSFTKRKE